MNLAEWLALNFKLLVTQILHGNMCNGLDHFQFCLQIERRKGMGQGPLLQCVKWTSHIYFRNWYVMCIEYEHWMSKGSVKYEW